MAIAMGIEFAMTGIAIFARARANADTGSAAS
jgi:hypothetical protein